MLACDTFHQIHHQLIVVIRQIRLFVDRGKFKLIRCHLIMTGFQRDTQFVCFKLHITHIGSHTFWYGTKVVIIQLLIFCRSMSHQRATRHTEIGTCIVKSRINQKIFLFPTQVGIYLRNILIEILTNCNSRLVNCRNGLQQWGFIIQRLSCIGDENSWNTQSRAYHKCRR